MSDQTTGVPVPSPSSLKPSGTDLQQLEPDLLNAYKLMLQYQFIGALGLIAILTAILLAAFLATSNWNPPLLVLVAMCGMLGAFFSALTRLYNVDQFSVALITPITRQLGGRYLMMFSLVPPIIGAIAAVVIYIVFLAGMLGGGGLLPVMDCAAGQKCDSLLGVLHNFGPKEAQDFGKVFVWAFAAGFSERLVPNTLQSLVAKLQSDGK
jgi:hypothetical protein